MNGCIICTYTSKTWEYRFLYIFSSTWYFLILYNLYMKLYIVLICIIWLLISPHIYFFFLMTALGLHCCVHTFSGCCSWGLFFSCDAPDSHCAGFSCCEARALGMHASVVVACGLGSCGSQASEHRLSSFGAWAQLSHGIWDLLGPGIKHMSPVLTSGFFTTKPQGNPWVYTF